MGINNDTKICEIIDSYDEYIKNIAEQLTDFSVKKITEENMSCIIRKVEVKPTYDEDYPFRIHYVLNLGGVSIPAYIKIGYNEDLKENIEILIKKAKFDLKLIDEYPDEFELWAFMYTHENIRGDKFCDLLVWPNTTKTSFGGGDYEIKRIKSVYAPQYLKRLNESIESYTDILSKLFNYKKDFEKLVKEMEEKDNDKRAD